MHEKKDKILVVDDEAQVRKMLSIFLSAENFIVEESETGKQALRMSASVKPDLILLDMELPDMDGSEVMTSLREWSQVPIVALSGRADDAVIIAALNGGADDCVVKPFNAGVLVARVKANLRKAIIREEGDPELINGDVRMDLIRHEVFLRGEKISLTPKEYELLRYFMANRGCMLTHKQMLQQIWGPAYAENTQYLRVYVGLVREKLENDPTNPQMIITQPGVGYRMEILPAGIYAAA